MMEEDFELLDPIDGLSVKERGQLKKIQEIVKRIEEQKIDITENCGTQWDKIAFSLTFFGEHGIDLFLRVSRLASNYDVEKAREFYNKKLLSKTKAKSPGAFINVCKNFGINVETAKEVIEGAKGKPTQEDLLPDGANVDDWKTYGFWEQSGVYWSLTPQGHTREVTNFTMQILYHMKRSKDEAFKIIKIKNDFGFESIIYLNTDDFISVGTFRKAIMRFGRYLFKGNDVDLMKLQDKLLREEKSTKEVMQLGYDKKENIWFFSNGLCEQKTGDFFKVDEYGICEFQENNYFIPANSKIYSDDYESFENEKRFVYLKSDVNFHEWADTFCKVFPAKGWMGIVFWFGSVHRDIIFEHIRRFPILNLYGQKGTGKGAMAESLLRLFGNGQYQLMLGGASTVKGFMRKLAQYSNSIVWLDEYKNNLDKKNIESLKNIYDGIGYERAKNDLTNQTRTTPVNSTVILSGQEMPTIEPALFTRVIMLQFDKLDLNDEKKDLYRKLQEMEKKGISFLTIEAVKHRDHVKKKFPQYLKEESKYLVESTKKYASHFEERVIVNYASMIALCKIMSECMSLPFTFIDYRSWCLDQIVSQSLILSGSDDASKFWEIVEQLFARGIIRDGFEFMLKDGSIFIRINIVYGEYAKELRQRSDPNILAKSTLENYLQSDRSIFKNKLKKHFSGSHEYVWCYEFDYSKLGISLISGSAEEVRAKHKEMKVEFEEELVVSSSQQSMNFNSDKFTDDLPF